MKKYLLPILLFFTSIVFTFGQVNNSADVQRTAESRVRAEKIVKKITSDSNVQLSKDQEESITDLLVDYLFQLSQATDLEKEGIKNRYNRRAKKILKEETLVKAFIKATSTLTQPKARSFSH